MEETLYGECGKVQRGGRRRFAGRKKTCSRKIPFNRRINENILKILKDYAAKYGLTVTEALESAVLLQSNTDKRRDNKTMKIAMPAKDGKLCGHFGHCESFIFADIDPDTKEILNIESKVPEEGISCESANWISEQGVNVVLAGGMGGRPLGTFVRNGVTVVAGCPEGDPRELIKAYFDGSLVNGENSCGEGEHSHCHHHSHGGHQGHCGGHH